MDRKQSGFTFLETLLVLTVFIVCLSAAFIPIRERIEKTEQQLFLNQLERDLFFAQTYAITRGQHVSVAFFDQNKNKYSIVKLTVPAVTLVERDIPADIRPAEYGIKSITFFNSGTTNRFGTVYFVSTEKQLKLVFLIGRGRFYFAE